MASWQSIPDQVERAQVKRGDASGTRIQRAAVSAFSGSRIDPRGLTPQGILQLQRTAGNAAVNALLSGRAARGAAVQREAAEEEEQVQAMGSAQYEAVQRHTHRIHPHPQGTNVWNTDDENE
jgi:hypothetical protein